MPFHKECLWFAVNRCNMLLLSQVTIQYNWFCRLCEKSSAVYLLAHTHNHLSTVWEIVVLATFFVLPLLSLQDIILKNKHIWVINAVVKSSDYWAILIVNCCFYFRANEASHVCTSRSFLWKLKSRYNAKIARAFRKSLSKLKARHTDINKKLIIGSRTFEIIVETFLLCKRGHAKTCLPRCLNRYPYYWKSACVETHKSSQFHNNKIENGGACVSKVNLFKNYQNLQKIIKVKIYYCHKK